VAWRHLSATTEVAELLLYRTSGDCSYIFIIVAFVLPVTYDNMADRDCLDAEKADNDVAGEVEKPTPKEYFTLEGSVLINIMS